MENITNFEQERINVELYMEKLLDVKEECEYGSDKRRKIIGTKSNILQSM